jgi:hypothetical protein
MSERGKTAQLGEVRNAYYISEGTPRGKKSLEMGRYTSDHREIRREEFKGSYAIHPVPTQN